MPPSDYCDRWPTSGGPNGYQRAKAVPCAKPGPAHDFPLFNDHGRPLNLPSGASFGVGGDHLGQSMLVAVLDGVVKGYIEMANGQRLIFGFRFAGDVLLIPPSEQHLFLVIEALAPTKLLRLNDSELSRLRASHPELDLRLWEMSGLELARITRHMLRLGCMDAQARIASFLLEMRGLLNGAGSNRASLWLPMARQDIAEYLGLKPETVSRHFSRLREAGVIDTPTSKHVVVKDRDRLLALAGLSDGAGDFALNGV